MSDASEAPTLTLEDDIQDLPEDEDAQEKDTDVAVVSLISLNPSFKSIALIKNKTILGRNSEKCTEGALLVGKMISGSHCEISSRSMTDMDAAIWIKDTSSNGVWVNENRLVKNEPTKIVNKDIITFASKSVHPNGDTPVYVLIDERKKSTFKDQQQENAKRINEELGIDSSAEDSELPEKKKQKTEVNTADNEDKEKEESAFEKEFECGICHEIMHKALVLQPCLHSFCRECCKTWLQNSTVCPSCRQQVTMTKRGFKLNNLITLFIKGRPHLARDDVEDDGAGSDSSNVVLGNRRNRYSDDDDDDDDEYSDDDIDGRNVRLPPGFNGLPPACPCCDPNNTLGYVCPDAIRLGPLPPNATYADYMARRNFQPGHTQCRGCRVHLPILPQTTQDTVADRFRCKMCCVPSCGCQLRSVEDNITRSTQILGYFNSVEERIIGDYLAMENMTPQNVWQEVKDGMDNGTLRYLGTTTTPVTVPSNTSAPPVATDDGTAPQDGNIDAGSGSNSTASSATAMTVNPNADATTSIPISITAAMLPLPSLSLSLSLSRVNRAQTVTSSDKLCQGCSRDFLSNGPLYQWRKNLDPTKFPVQVTTRESCWWGRECRTQYNQANLTHAERLNHVCDKTSRR